MNDIREKIAAVKMKLVADPQNRVLLGELADLRDDQQQSQQIVSASQINMPIGKTVWKNGLRYIRYSDKNVADERFHAPIEPLVIFGMKFSGRIENVVTGDKCTDKYIWDRWTGPYVLGVGFAGIIGIIISVYVAVN